ncbi:hypothetical protein VTK73DRAFT_4414 [Phialemonium thermophilum]|uniref:Uncharacterized protein n=1 Tax=Phialemonium thermophilum TaxID=223376 RepID=A0ABR3VAS3_9PEZI
MPPCARATRARRDQIRRDPPRPPGSPFLDDPRRPRDLEQRGGAKDPRLDDGRADGARRGGGREGVGVRREREGGRVGVEDTVQALGGWKRGMSSTAVQAKGVAAPLKVIQTWPAVSWQKPAAPPANSSLVQARPPAPLDQVRVMEPTVGLVARRW